MGKPSSGKEAAANTDKGKAGKPVSKEGKGKSKPWSAYRQGEAEDNYRHRREVRTSKGLKRSSRSTVAKSRDRPGKAERRLALYNKGEEVDPTPSQFPILPNNFNPDLPPKRRKTKPEREEAGPAPKQGEEGSSYSYYSESEGAEEPSSSAAPGPSLRLREGPGAGLSAPEPPQERVKEEELQDHEEEPAQLLEVQSDSSVEVIQVESTPWQRRKIKKELETLPDDVHFVGTKVANIAKPKTGHHYLSEVLVMSRNPFTGVKTSQELSKLGQGTHKHVYDFDQNRVIKFASDHGNEAHYCACFPKLTAQITHTAFVRIKLLEQGSPLLISSTAVLQEKVQLAKDWLLQKGKDSEDAKEFVYQAFAVTVWLSSQKLHLKDVGPGNLGIRLLPTPRVCYFDTMGWCPARPRSKPYQWSGLWKLAQQCTPAEYSALNRIRTQFNQDWSGMFGAYADQCRSYHPVLKQMGVMRSDGSMQNFQA